MSGKTATIIGSTGLVGSELLKVLLGGNEFQTIRLVLRRQVDVQGPRVEKKIVDFSDNDSLLLALENSDAIFSTIGTTIKKVKGDLTEYRKIDVGLPEKLARFARMTGCPVFSMVSAIGANARSRNFYLQIKGEAEEAVRASGPASIHIMRPAMIIGNRKEFRFLERLFIALSPLMKLVMPSKYKPIKATTIARAMVVAAREAKPGFYIYEYKEMKELAALSQP
jgi:uncharacterized protein YbjT (DUF2867 family)